MVTKTLDKRLTRTTIKNLIRLTKLNVLTNEDLGQINNIMADRMARIEEDLLYEYKN